VARQKILEAAITGKFPLGRVAGDATLGHRYVEDSSDGGRGSPDPCCQLAPLNSERGFGLDGDRLERALQQVVL
jgi:hypothetical protein